MRRRRKDSKDTPADHAAGNGLLSRRVFLEGAMLAGVAAPGAAAADPLAVARWMQDPGAAFVPYGQPSRFESKVGRAIVPAPNPATPGIGAIRTPLQHLNGMITP